MNRITINLLLVEDNPDDAYLLQETLSETPNARFVITAVESLADAFQRLAEQRFDAVLLDLGLPDSFGLDTVRQTLAQAPKELPIIVLTGNEDIDLPLKAVQAGAQDYLVKNWTHPELLVRTILYAIERKQAEKELWSTNQLLEKLFSNIDVKIAYMDPDFNFIRVNRAYAEVDDKTPEFFLGKNHFDLYPNAENEAIFQNVVETGEPYYADARAFEYTDQPDREITYWNWTLQPVIAANGQVEGVLLSLIDVTERVKAEEVLKKTVEELARSNQELDQFAYIASHDLREPLRNVTGCLQLLTRHYSDKLDADGHELIELAAGGTDRMKRLIDDLLTYSRVGSRARELAPINCEWILEHALANLKTAIEENQATISHDSLPTVMGDEIQLAQLFQNLIGNALKFRSDAPPHIHVGAKPQNGDWLFWVQDNGIGLNPNKTERIFQIFQRLHARDKYPGTGIGLAICKKVVEQHGGQIWVESEPGRGATFYFNLKGADT